LEDDKTCALCTAGARYPEGVSFDPIEQLLMRFLFVFASEGMDRVSEIQRLAEVHYL
jgi:hypothetical protein